LEYKENEIIISCGAKHSLFNAVCSSCNEDEEAIISSPFWVSCSEMVRAAGAKPVFISVDESNFKIKPQDIKDAVTQKTKLLILNSPSNPAGTIYTKDELEEIAKVLLEQIVRPPGGQG